ncbi:putative UTP-monosaccharide-1-phosphate uridylyltransferase [Helianthus annuus]|nr:putative UTP-monosaccharide-1-phosphate uridylyltransferase [Helianthus annuus]
MYSPLSSSKPRTILISYIKGQSEGLRDVIALGTIPLADIKKFNKIEKVAWLADNDARLALEPNYKYRIQTKSHSHGDVHPLIYSSGLLKEWFGNGV